MSDQPEVHSARGEQLVEELFTTDVVARLSQVRRPPPASEWDTACTFIRSRHEILDSNRSHHPAWLQAQYGARRRTWAAQLASAEKSGLLDAEFRMRLTGGDDSLFRGAMAECLTAWFFQDRLGQMPRRLTPSATKMADFEIQLEGGASLRMEVKSPYVPVVSNHWSGEDSHVVRA
jgi:hypothetical protein